MPFAIIPFLVQMAVGLALQVIGYILMPKPKGPKPEAVKDLDAPTAEANIPIGVVFGEVTIKGPNIIGFYESATRTYEVKA